MTMPVSAAAEPRLVPGRSCGTCSLCCKVLRIEETASPAGEWCKHCDPGHGCRVHPTRPAACRDFFCMWLTHSEVGDHWVPAKSKMVLRPELNGARIAAHVDKSTPGAWLRSPYYDDLKRWAKIAAEGDNQVSVWIGMHAIVILPERDVDLGVVDEDEVVVSTKQVTPAGLVLGAEKIKRSELVERQKQWAAARQHHAAESGAGNLAAGVALPRGL
jgi:hypothetical protein